MGIATVCTHSTIPPRSLVLMTLLFGFSSAVAQVLLVREILTVFRGSELVIGAIFAAWFLGIYFGTRAFIQAEAERLRVRALRAFLALPLVLPVCLYLAHLLPALMPTAKGAHYSIITEFICAMALSAPAGICIGLYFPPAVTLMSAEKKSSGGAMIFTIESLGSFSGGLAFSFIMVDHLNPLAISSLLSLLSICVYIAVTRDWRFLAAACAAAALLFTASAIEQAFFARLWNHTHAGALTGYVRTRCQMASFERLEDQTNVYGDGIFYFAFPDRYGARLPFHLIRSLMRTGNERICIFGGGPGSLALNLARSASPPLAYCESDPWLPGTIMKLGNRDLRNAVDSGRIRLIPDDFRHHLSQWEGRYDIILCLPPPPENARLNRFYTAEFYELCRQRLSEEGILVAALHGYANYMGADRKGFIASIYKAFRGRFPFLLATSGDTVYLIGAKSRGVLPESGEALMREYRNKFPMVKHSLLAGGIDPELLEGFRPEELGMLFEPTQGAYFDAQMRSILDQSGENRDMKPGAYWSYLLLSALQEDSPVYVFLKAPLVLAAIAAAAILFALCRTLRMLGRIQFFGAVVTTALGFISISAVILMILIYQNFHGNVYHRIALVNAAFMLGLFCGGLFAMWRRMRFSWISFASLLLLLLASGAYVRSGFEVFFWPILFMFSSACGTVIPSLFALLGEEDYLRTARNLNAMDHLGAVAGSILIPLSLLPALGVQGALATQMLVAGAAGVYSLLAGRQKT